MNKRNQLKSAAFRAQVKELLEQGYAVSKIAKITGKSYTHTRQIVEQERGHE